MSKYDIIIADPPWNYKDKGRGSTAGHYQVMKLRDIVELGKLVQQVSHEQSVVLMWGCWPLMFDPKYDLGTLIRAWGFEPKTCAFMYYKTLKDDDEAFRKGRGAYTAANSEPCILGRRKGKMLPVKSRKVRQVIYEKTGQPIDLRAANLRHSEKPAEFYDRVDELYEGYSKLELFARRERPGWTCLGNEIDGMDIRDALQGLIDQGSAETA